MATYNQNGRDALPDENRASWRPHDESNQGVRGRGNDDDRDYRSFRDRNYQDQDRYAGNRDPRRWEGSRGSELGYYEDRDSYGRSTESYGQGQSGYSAGRHGDDRAQRIQNRNEMISPRYPDERYRSGGLGLDDRFTGRGGYGGGHWEDRSERWGSDYRGDRGGFRSSGHGDDREERWTDYRDDRGGFRAGYGDDRGERWGSGDRGFGRGYDERMGYGHGEVGYGPRGYHEGSFAEPTSYPRGGYGGSSEQRSERGSQGRRGSGPHRGKGPQGYQRSDERLREMICEALSEDDHIDASQIEVTVKNGEVTLGGHVDDRRTKREAEDCACGVSGVRDVQNQIRVKDERGERQAGRPASTPSTSYGKTESDTFAQDKKPRA